MFYVKWTEHELKNLSKARDINVLLTEIDLNGNVLREIGLDKHHRIVHKSPTLRDNYGLFDNQKILIKDLINNLSLEEFQKYWELRDENDENEPGH